ncbi:hypothetical protein ABT56_10265 [Photobacterium aquae]|uniref:Uncharacterized protein n=1 Tax=Photobacterium aquae TaxID=1195763 RepID=A0A0J1H267_9GAMM|nr:hypothetical protein [Photobacterium aquae]KLV05900.1 hypothetical protein ABT56_10265 [Photobacterium aquae]
MKFVCKIVFGVLFAALFSSSVLASGGGRNTEFGQNACKLPSGEYIFVPWHVCLLKGGRSI